MIRVVLIDDHQLVRAALRAILEQQPDITVVGEASNAQCGLALIREATPDVAVTDVHMPGMSGLELTERVARAHLRTHIVILTAIDNAYLPRRLLEAGARGYLTKKCQPDELVSALRRVAQGRRYLAPTTAQKLALAALDGDDSPFDRLSNRELEVAMMLVRGRSLADIGERLHLSPKTVSTYKQRLLDKLEVGHVVGVAHLMIAHGLMDMRQFTLVSDPNRRTG